MLPYSYFRQVSYMGVRLVLNIISLIIHLFFIYYQNQESGIRDCAPHKPTVHFKKGKHLVVYPKPELYLY